MSDLARFQTMLRDWLARNELDRDLRFYSAEDWRARTEEVLNTAEFVVTTEGGLHYLLNYNFADPRVDQLQDLCESFGFWFELGHTWSLGFYRLPEMGFAAADASRSYKEKLKDPRWIKKAATVKARANDRCEDCGIQTDSLEAHHCWYRYGFEPWQYPLDALRALCSACHASRGKIEHQMRTSMARLSAEEVCLLHKGISQLFHWYDRRAARRLLESLGPDEKAMEDAFSNLRNRKTEPGAV